MNSLFSSSRKIVQMRKLTNLNPPKYDQKPQTQTKTVPQKPIYSPILNNQRRVTKFYASLLQGLHRRTLQEYLLRNRIRCKKSHKHRYDS